MKTLILLIILAVTLAGLPIVVASDTSPTDSNIVENEINTNQSKASNSSASATITITMYAVADE